MIFENLPNSKTFPNAGLIFFSVNSFLAPKSIIHHKFDYYKRIFLIENFGNFLLCVSDHYRHFRFFFIEFYGKIYFHFRISGGFENCCFFWLHIMDLYVCQVNDYFTVSVLCSYHAIFLVKLRSTDAEVHFSFFFVHLCYF